MMISLAAKVAIVATVACILVGAAVFGVIGLCLMAEAWYLRAKQPHWRRRNFTGPSASAQGDKEKK